ncbi:MAG: AMP-binding protein [Bdellovibrionota bacterium]
MSFVQTIFSHLQRDPGKALLVQVQRDQLVPTSNQQMVQWISSARKQLQDKGIAKGDRVVLLSDNSPQWVACDLAIISLGAITVPLYPRQDEKELAFMAQDCQPKLFIASDEKLQQKVFSHWTDPCDLVFVDALLGAHVESNDQEEWVSLNPEDIVTIIYTSGTSGHPKGVMLSAGNIDYMLDRTCAQLNSSKMKSGNQDRVFHFLPLCFAGSRLMFWTQMYRNNPTMLSTDLANLAQEMATANPQFYLNVPAILERIKKGVEDRLKSQKDWIYQVYQKTCQIHRQQSASLAQKIYFRMAKKILLEKIKQKIGPQLEFLICGSAALHPDTQMWFEMLGISVLQVYGLTETTGIITMDEFNSHQVGKVGKVIEGCEVKLTQEGELLCKGPNVFQGYWNRDKETQDCFEGDWFRTGDLATLSEEGFVEIVGRTKNVIIPSSGHNIVPEVIEKIIKDLVPQVDHAVVIGHGRPYLTALVSGQVSEDQFQDLLEKVNQGFPHYKKIRKLRKIEEGFTVENGSLTINQKLKRKDIEKNFEDEIQALYQTPSESSVSLPT